MHHNEVELTARNVAQHSWESRLILNGEQPEAFEDSEVALNDPGCIARAHPTAALSDSDPEQIVLASTHTRWPRLQLFDKVN